METLNVTGLIPLTKEEQVEINGGFLPVLWTAVAAYVTICALAEAAGIATAYIVNKLS